MSFVKRKVITSKSHYSDVDFEKLKHSFLENVVSTVMMEEVPMELVMNWDQTGIKIVPSSCWTMDEQGSQRVEINGIGDKRMIAAVLCGTLMGDFLPIQLIYAGKTTHCHPRYKFPLG